jgi:hypothetical protein
MARESLRSVYGLLSTPHEASTLLVGYLRPGLAGTSSSDVTNRFTNAESSLCLQSRLSCQELSHPFFGVTWCKEGRVGLQVTPILDSLLSNTVSKACCPPQCRSGATSCQGS